MVVIKGQVVGVVEKVSKKGTPYKMIKLLEMDGFAKLTFVQDFRGVTITNGEHVEMEVSVRPYLNKNGNAEIAYTAWAPKEGQEAEAPKPLAAVGGRYK